VATSDRDWKSFLGEVDLEAVDLGAVNLEAVDPEGGATGAKTLFIG